MEMGSRERTGWLCTIHWRTNQFVNLRRVVPIKAVLNETQTALNIKENFHTVDPRFKTKDCWQRSPSSLKNTATRLSHILLLD